MPLPKPPGLVARVANVLASGSKEVARALPVARGGETHGQLQTYRTDIFSHFTKPSLESELLYSAENWVTITLDLETAGPVAVGTVAEITPVLSGKGILLDTDKDRKIVLPKGTRVYITSQTVNRVNVTVEPIPWLEQLDADTIASQASVRSAVFDIGHSIVNAINALRGLGKTESSTGRTPDQMSPVPQGTRRFIPRLTPGSPPPKMR